MARTKGSKNKNATRIPDTVLFSTEQKLEFIATLIVERILDDQQNGQKLFNQIARMSTNGAE